jgi:hypothetical protein
MASADDLLGNPKGLVEEAACCSLLVKLGFEWVLGEEEPGVDSRA